MLARSGEVWSCGFHVDASCTLHPISANEMITAVVRLKYILTAV